MILKIFAAVSVVVLQPGAVAVPDLSEPESRYVIVLRPGKRLAQERLIRRLGGQVVYRYDAALLGFAAVLPPVEARELAADQAVRLVEPDGVVRGGGMTVQWNPPNWGLDRIDQRGTALNNGYGYANDGAGVHVYVIDSGIRMTHREFGGRADSLGDWIGDGRNGQDCHGHGTHVAGVVGGATYGVAKGARIHSLRVLDCEKTGLTSGVTAAVDWVTRHAARPAVINLSIENYGLTPNSLALETAVSGAIAAGIPVVTIAGNWGSDDCQRVVPGRVPTAITVAMVARNNRRAPDSNFGRCVDVFAPGTDILSSNWPNDTAAVQWSGTSMAAPHVTGVVAKFLQRRPDASPNLVSGFIQATATANAVTDPGAGTPNRLLFSDPTGPDNDGFAGGNGDFNGDGRDDIIRFTRERGSDVWVALSLGGSFHGGTNIWQPDFGRRDHIPLVGDFNADNLDDVIAFTRGAEASAYVALSNGIAFGDGQLWSSSIAPGDQVPLVGDFNGDGYSDAAAAARGVTGDLSVALSYGRGFIPARMWGDAVAFESQIPLVGDVNGDHRDDVIAVTRNNTGDVFVALSDGSRLATQTKWHDDFNYSPQLPAVADVNGDGKDDLITFENGISAGVWVALSDGRRFGPFTYLKNTSFGAGRRRPGVGDFNGDLRADLVAYASNGSVTVSIGNASGANGPAAVWHDRFAQPGDLVLPATNW